MKHCPACDFTFPDFRRVCDFDGTELVSDPERQSLVKVQMHRQRPRRSLGSSMLLTSLAVLGVFLTAVLIGHPESPAPSIPAIVKNQETDESPARLTPPAKATEQLAGVKRTAEPSKRTGSRNVNRLAVPSTARLRQRGSADSRSRNEVIARTRDSKRTAGEKLPKIAAILKTTWKVLKKPFDF